MSTKAEVSRYIRNVTDAMERRGHLEITRDASGHRHYKLTDAGQQYYSENKIDLPGQDTDLGDEPPK